LDLTGIAQKANLNQLYAVRLKMKERTQQMPTPGMTADGFTDREMTGYAEFVKREIQNIEGVSDVIIYGKRKECILKEIDNP